MTTNAQYAPPRPQPRPRRIQDALDSIKQELDLLHADRDSIRAQRDDLETQVNHQVNEVNTIRRSLYDLEVQQGKVRQHYEDELRRLRLELAGLRQAQGIPGFHPVPIPGPTDSKPPDIDLRPKARETDRIQDSRDPKRPKPERETTPPDPALPPPHVLYPAGPSSVRPHPRSPSDYHLPPINPTPQSSFPDELNVPPEFRKEGSDWFAVFNPRVKRSLDISLVHNLVHASVVCCVQFSLDGKYLATGCNRTAQIYDVKTGAKICVLADENANKSGDLYIRSVRFSPDGKLLATGAEDRQIRIWDIAKKRIRNVFVGHSQEIYSLDFSLDGRFIISGSGDKTARIWDMHDDSSSKVLTINDTDSLNNDAGVTSVAISPNGALVAAGSLDTIVRIWDVKTGALVERLRGHRDSVYSVAFTPDGRGLVSGSLDKTLKYWDVAALAARKGPEEVVMKKPGEKAPPGGMSACTMDFVGHKDYVLSVSVSHDGQWVVSGSKDRCVQFWDIRNATLQFVLQGHKNSGPDFTRCEPDWKHARDGEWR
ncbi:hypothetical protein C0995_004389 [Termitomyces sp. Mi166|nr:hypothetical protein C0995_004389 [Termitomyces sp. Mi166\